MWEGGDEVGIQDGGRMMELELVYEEGEGRAGNE